MSAKVKESVDTPDCREMVEETERRSFDRAQGGSTQSSNDGDQAGSTQARAEKKEPETGVDKNPVKLLEETRQLLELAKSVRQFAAQNPISVFKKDENGNNSTKRMEDEEDSMEVQISKKAKGDDQDENGKDIYFDGVTFKK